MRSLLISVLTAVAALGLLAACSGGEVAQADNLEGTGGAVVTACDSFPDVTGLPARSISEITAGLDGGGYRDDLPHPGVAGAGANGMFTPGADDTAWGIWEFGLPGYEQGRYLDLTWSVAPSGTVWVGLANRVAVNWDWYRPEDGRVTIAAVEDYLGDGDNLLAVVVVYGGDAAMLEGLAVTGRPPVVYGIAPDLAAPGEPVDYQALAIGDEPLSYAWNFGGAALPATSTAAQPAVTSTVAGEYIVTVTVSNALGSAVVVDTVTLGDTTPVAAGVLTAVPERIGALVGDPVRVTVSCGDLDAAAPFICMDSVSVTVPTGGDYVTGSFNIGTPGGFREDTDGIWGNLATAPTDYFLPEEFMMSASSCGSGDLVFMKFHITPIGASDITAGGDLFNFEIEFSEPGTYTLGFLDLLDTQQMTYYSDGEAGEHVWADTSNDHARNTITVYGEE